MTIHRITGFSPFLLLGLFLGIGFVVLCPSTVVAIDSTSPLFHQDKTATMDKTNPEAPLSLPEETPNPSPGVFSTLLRLFLALGLIVALIVVTILGLKLILDKKSWSTFGEEGKAIRVLSSTFLAPRKTIHLIEVGKRILVVGVGTDEMTCLDVIEDPSEVELLRNSNQQGFPKIFNRVIQKHETIQQQEEAQRIVEESKELVDGYVKSLKKISKKQKENNRPSDGNA